MDADRPNLQLALGSVEEERRKHTVEQEAGYCCSKLTLDSFEMETPGSVSS